MLYRFQNKMAISLIAFVISVMLSVVMTGNARSGPHLVFDYKSGVVYSSNRAFDAWHPASLTKMMTAYTVFREISKKNISLKSPVLVSNYALSKPPSKMGFPVGTVLNIETALKIILVKSANDISTALAESVGGSEKNFAKLMNESARDIGMADSNFVNPHGLHNDNQITTARDLGILARRIYTEFPQYKELFKIAAIKVHKRALRNHNALLRRFEGTTGMKTGFICESGTNIVVSAELNSLDLVSIVLGAITSKLRNLEAARLLKMASEQTYNQNELIFDALKKPQNANSKPANLRSSICGKHRTKLRKFDFSDEASELFAIKAPSPTYLAEQLYRTIQTELKVEKLSLNNATGPDPFKLLVPIELSEKDPMVGDQENDQLFKADSGDLVPIPIRRPEICGMDEDETKKTGSCQS